MHWDKEICEVRLARSHPCGANIISTQYFLRRGNTKSMQDSDKQTIKAKRSSYQVQHLRFPSGHDRTSTHLSQMLPVEALNSGGGDGAQNSRSAPGKKKKIKTPRQEIWPTLAKNKSKLYWRFGSLPTDLAQSKSDTKRSQKYARTKTLQSRHKVCNNYKTGPYSVQHMKTTPKSMQDMKMSSNVANR